MLCFPCSPTSTAVHFDEKQAEETTVKMASTKNDDSLQKPTGAEYTREAAKEFLNVLDAVAQEVPVPGVSTAVKLAINLIKICEESQATLEKAEELKLRIKTLVTVVVNASKEKKAAGISENLKKDIDALHRELKYIEKKLDEIASQHAFLLVFFKSFNEQKVQNCMNRLDSLLERFTMERHLDHAELLGRLEKEITSFYNEQQKTLDHIRKVVEDTNITMEHVASILSAPTRGSSSSDARAPIPPGNTLFYGRDALVVDLAARLTTTPDGQRQPHMCILGPGGMGKTSAALAVMAHSDVKTHYHESNCIWVPCVKATSVPLFLDTLCSSLGITQVTGNIHAKILSVLKSSGPLILLLDNFESPWNADGGRSETERILREIDQVPHVTLFLTMRASTAPCNGLRWHSVDLKALDAHAASHIYSEIYPDGGVDPELPALLDLVGNMPLAITLMAKIASISGVSARMLMEQYNSVGPSLLSQGSDAENSMDICISLSVDSPPMTRSPEARWLLGALAMLPVGTTFEMLSKWWAHHLPNPLGALQVLRDTSLVERRDSIFCVLPVIQRYILNPARFNIDITFSMVQSACKYLDQHKSSPGDEPYKEDAKALAAEEGNLEAILLQATIPSAEILNAHLILARYQASVRPRTIVIEHALKLVLGMENDTNMHAAILLCYGRISYNLERLQDAKRHLSDARELFLSVSDVKQAADCLFRLLDVAFADPSVLPPSEIIPSLSQTQSKFESTGDVHGVAQCWYYSGIIALQSRNFREALDLLNRAYDELTRSSDPLLSARCTDYIAFAYYWSGDLEQAETWSRSAVERFERLGPSEWSVEASFLQGFILVANSQYAAALKIFARSLEQSKKFDTPFQTGLALVFMGVSWMKTGQKEDARTALQEALRVFPSTPGRADLVVCRYLLRKMEQPSTVPTDLEKSNLDTYFPLKMQQLLGL